MLEYNSLAPFQLTPNFYGHMIRFYILCHKLGYSNPAPKEFTYLYFVKANLNDHGFDYSSKWPDCKLKALIIIKSNMGK